MRKTREGLRCAHGVCSFFNVLYRAWYVDGRFLVVAVTFGIILPLCLLKNLGKMHMSLWE